MAEKEGTVNIQNSTEKKENTPLATRDILQTMRRQLGAPPEDTALTRANLQTYLQEYNKRYDSNPKNKLQIEKDLDDAQNKIDSHDLQGGWQAHRMARLFLDHETQNQTTNPPIEFIVNLKNIERFEKFIGAAHLLPPTVNKIEVTDNKGNKRIGNRQINGRIGYFDGRGYIPVYTGYKIRILETVTSVQSEQSIQQERKVFEQMNGTNWPKKDDSPTETVITPAPVNRSTVQQNTPHTPESSGTGPILPRPNRPETLTDSDTAGERRGNLEIEGIGQVYINMPSNPEAFLDSAGKPKKPQYIAYFHGNGGYETNKSLMDSHIKKLRSGGVPAILVFIRDDASMGSKDSGLRWQNMKKNGSFKSIMEEVQKWTKVPVNQNINLVSFSGGYIGQGEALRQTTGTDYGKLQA